MKKFSTKVSCTTTTVYINKIRILRDKASLNMIRCIQNENTHYACTIVVDAL